MSKYGDTDGDGCIDYRSASGRASPTRGGRLGRRDERTPTAWPVPGQQALVELQGYATTVPDGALARASGDRRLHADRSSWIMRPADLKNASTKDFWMTGKRVCQALPYLAEGEEALRGALLNPGQALWWHL